MNIFKKLFCRPKTPVDPTVKERKKYTFSKDVMTCIGDRYTYEVLAESKEEAFKKLVIYFFSPGGGGVHSDIESKHGTLSNPYKDHFSCVGMPYWFARRISGYVRDTPKGIDNQKTLEEYCAKHGIELERNS